MELTELMEHSLRTCLERIPLLDREQGDLAVEKIRCARRIYVAAAGRSLLVMRAFAMRLMHLGKTVYIVGDTVTPAAGPGDLLLMASGSGETATLVAIAKKAAALHMQLLLFTTYPHSTLGELADTVMVLPGKAKSSQDNLVQGQPGGNIFEHLLFIAGDSMALRIAQLEHIDITSFSLHANLE